MENSAKYTEENLNMSLEIANKLTLGILLAFLILTPIGYIRGDNTLIETFFLMLFPTLWCISIKILIKMKKLNWVQGLFYFTIWFTLTAKSLYNIKMVICVNLWHILIGTLTLLIRCNVSLILLFTTISLITEWKTINVVINYMQDNCNKAEQIFSIYRIHIMFFTILMAWSSYYYMKTINNYKSKLQTAFEQLEKLSKTKDIFFASFSHELKNPINSMHNSIHMLRDNFYNNHNELLSDQDKLLFDCACDSSEILINMISAILDSTKLQVSKLELFENNVNPSVLLKRICSFGKSQTLIKCLTWLDYIDPHLSKELIIDGNRLTQIIINFLSNAIKYTKSGKVGFICTLWNNYHQDLEKSTISLSQFKTMNSNEISKLLKNSKDIMLKERHKEVLLQAYLKIEVLDSGIGITQQEKSRLFQAYSQANENIQKSYGGNGLGLWLCKKLVEMMKGHLIIDSEIGIGTNFIVIIPVKLVDKSDSPIQKSNNLTGSMNVNLKTHPETSGSLREIISNRKIENVKILNGMKILVTDDCKFNQIIYKACLERQGASVSLGNNGLECLNILKSPGGNTYDVILIDINMPELDGKTAIKQLRKWESENNQDPRKVIFVSANCIESEYRELLDPEGDVRAQLYLTKPISSDFLVNTIAKFKKNHTSIIKSAQYSDIRSLKANSERIMQKKLYKEEIYGVLILYEKNIINEGQRKSDYNNKCIIRQFVEEYSRNYQIQCVNHFTKDYLSTMFDPSKIIKLILCILEGEKPTDEMVNCINTIRKYEDQHNKIPCQIWLCTNRVPIIISQDLSLPIIPSSMINHNQGQYYNGVNIIFNQPDIINNPTYFRSILSKTLFDS